MEGVAGSPGARHLRKNGGRRISPSTLRNTVSGLLFVSPWLVGLLVFALYPILASAYFSLTSYNIVKSPEFIGLQNYRDLVVDKYFLRSLGNTLYYAVLYIPASTIISVSLALLLNMKVKGMAFYRTVFYLPSIVPAIAIQTTRTNRLRTFFIRFLLNFRQGRDDQDGCPANGC